MRYRNFIFDSARWEGFEHRPGDIIISTPPKCGTTWMQNIVGMLVLGTTEFDRPMAQLSPWLEQTLRDVGSVRRDLESQQHRRFVKSHTPLDGLPWHEDVTYVAVGRDPRDVAMSWEHHRNNIDVETLWARREVAVGLDDLAEMPPMRPVPESAVDRFWDWMAERAVAPEFAQGLEHLVIHLQSFWRRRREPNVAMLHYADLAGDLEGEMRRLAEQLHVAVDERRWPELVAAASFESMSERAEMLAPNANEVWKDTGSFFHRGGSGQWRDLIGEDQIARYEEILRGFTDDDEFLTWLQRP